MSSPPLRSEPYYGHKLDKQLDEQARNFILSERSFKIDRDKRIVFLSGVFKDGWYGNFFLSRYGTNKKFTGKEPAERAVLNFISNYVPQKDRDFILRKNYTVKYIRYNWTLNEKGKVRPRGKAN